MNRLKKELTSHGVIYECEGDEYEEERILITVTKEYIVTVWRCLVMPSEIHIFDKQYNMIGRQYLFPHDRMFHSVNEWIMKRDWFSACF